MKKLFAIILGLITVLFMVYKLTTLPDDPHDGSSDTYVRSHVVLLQGKNAQCTGVDVRTPSGKVYMLTASHCDVLLQNNQVKATYEDGTSLLLNFVEEDVSSDLMLLTSESKRGLKVADVAYQHEKVHTLTHGAGMPTYRTDGEFLKFSFVTISDFRIVTPADAAKCASMPKFSVQPEDSIFGPTGNLDCSLSVWEMLSTAMVLPGSSGGPVLNEQGQLVGIVSASAGYIFSGLVMLQDIKRFLSDY